VTRTQQQLSDEAIASIGTHALAESVFATNPDLSVEFFCFGSFDAYRRRVRQERGLDGSTGQ